jgi:hypothetical protein
LQSGAESPPLICRGMATSNYTIAPPSVAPLLHEYGDWDLIPEAAWNEYCAAQAYWARSRRYASQGEGRKARRQKQADSQE